MVRIQCGRRWPTSFVAVASDRYRILLADDAREWRLAGMIRCGDVLECRGLVTAIEPLTAQGEA